MTSAYKPAQMNYYGSGDESVSLQQSFEQANSGRARNYQIFQQNLATQIRTAGSGWEHFKDLSPTINKFVTHKAEKITKRKIAEGREWWYQNGYPQEQKDEHKAGKEELLKGGIQSYNIAMDWEEQGGDIFTSERFRKLDDIQKYGAVEGWAIDQANAYNPDSVPEIANALDPAERNAALTAYRMNFWEAMGDINHGIIDEYVDPALRAAEKSAYSSWYARRKEETKKQRIESATKKLIKDFKGETPAKSLLFFSEYMEKTYGSKRAARIAGLQVMKSLAGSGQLTPDDINKIRKEEFTAHDGSTQTFGGYYEAELDEVIDAFHDWEKSESDEAEAKKTVKHRNDVNERIAAYEDGTRELTVANLNEDIAAVGKDNLGYKATKLINIRDNLTKSKLELQGAKTRADKMINKGVFTEDALATFPWEIRLDAKYQKAAKEQTNIPEFHKNIIKDNGVIDKLVKKRGSTGLFAKDDHTTVEVISQMKQRYRELALDYARTWKEGDPDPYRQAWSDVNTWFAEVYGKSGSPNVSAGGFNTDLLYNTDGSSNIAENSTELINDLNKLNIAHNIYNFEGLSMPPNDLTGPDSTIYFHRSQIKAASKDIGGKNWKENKRLRYLADLNGVSYMTALNLQRKAVGMKGLDGSPAIDATKKINPQKEKEVNNAQNLDQTARAWSTYGFDTGENFISDIVPEGLGKECKAYEEFLYNENAENPFTASHMAAGIEMSLMFGDDINMYDAKDTNPHVYAAYWKAVYKYSGGSNTEALKNLMRF